MRGVLCAALLLPSLAAGAPPATYLIETEFEPPRAYVGSEVTLRLRLLRLPEAPYGVLRPPQSTDELEITTLPMARPYRTERRGTLYEVRERAYLVVPRRAGRFTLPAPEVIGPLRNVPGTAPATRAAPRVLEVHPPRDMPGAPWLPARRVWLEESWSADPGALAAGVPVVRTLVVRAEGLSGNRLPRIEMAAQPGLSVHHDATSFRSEYLEAGVAGRRIQRMVLIPREEGEIELPALSLPWWDQMADAPGVATLPARVLRVGAPAAAGAGPDSSAARSASGMDPLAAMRAFAVVLVALAAVVLWAYLRSQPLREARRQLRNACRRKNPQAVRDALVEWWKAASPGAPAPLLNRLGANWDASARAALAALDAALYGGAPWDGRAFWRALRPSLGRRASRRQTTAPALTPLFRLQARRHR
ncbi:MAG TPA: hypothetical protein VF876_12900 [Burkholderiales bacterium]